jgi:hypothetical protein
MKKLKLKSKVGISLLCLLFSSLAVMAIINHSNYIKDLRQSASVQRNHYMKVVFTVVPGNDEDKIHLAKDLHRSDDTDDVQMEYNLTFEVFTDNSSRTTVKSADGYGAEELENLEIKEYENSVAFVTSTKEKATGLTVERGIEIGFLADHNVTFVHYFLSKYNETGCYVFNSLGVIYNHDFGTARWEKSFNSVVIDSTWDVSLIEVFSDHSLLSQYLERF